MIYDIRHVTTYEYGSTVTFSHCALRLLPNDLPGQKVFATKLTIDPAPAQMIERTCFFGNRVTSLTIETEHRDLIVEVRTSVEINRDEPPTPGATQAFETVREEAFDSASLAKDFARSFPASEPVRAAVCASGRLCARELSARASGS